MPPPVLPLPCSPCPHPPALWGPLLVLCLGAMFPHPPLHPSLLLDVIRSCLFCIPCPSGSSQMDLPLLAV